METLLGGAENDFFVGSSGGDLLTGDLGADILFGREGNDELQGNPGDDLLFGNQGADNLSGGLGMDSLFGGQGNDVLVGDGGADFLFGDLGSDTVTGGAGRDTIAIAATTGGPTLADADVLTDFQGVGSAEPDVIRLVNGLRPQDVEVSANGNGDAVLRDRTSGNFLAVLLGVAPAGINLTDPNQVEWFTTAIAPEFNSGTGSAVLRFNSEIDGASFNDPNAFFIEVNGVRVAGQVVVDSDARSATFIPNSPLPAGEVQVVVNGDRILDSRGLPVDVSGGGIPGQSQNTIVQSPAQTIPTPPSPSPADTPSSTPSVEVVGIRTVDGIATEPQTLDIGGDSGVFQIFRGTTTGDLTVDFTITDALTGKPAALGVDYDLIDRLGNGITTNQVVIPASLDVVPVLVRPRSDQLTENPEQVQLALVDGANYDLDPANTIATVSIQDATPLPPAPFPIAPPPAPAPAPDPDLPLVATPAPSPSPPPPPAPPQTVNVTSAGGIAEVSTGTAFITISRGIVTAGDLTVSFRTTDTVGMIPVATITDDYSLSALGMQVTNSVTIPDGASQISLDVSSIDDMVGEGTEQANITLIPGAGYVVGSSATASVTIDDDEPTVTIAATTASAIENGPNGEFTISRGTATSGALAVTFDILTDVAPDTAATRVDDYELLVNSTIFAGNSVTIPDGATSVTIEVNAGIDMDIGPELVRLQLTGNSGYLPDPTNNIATVSIEEPVAPPPIK